jgi:hypothetical protein
LRILTTIGLIMMITGFSMAGIGLSFNVFPSSVAVDCSGYPASGCIVTAQVTNTGTAGFTAPFTAWFVYTNNLGQTVLVDKVTWAAGQTAVSDMFPSTAAGGSLGFTVNVFFQDSAGNAMGQSMSAHFSVSGYFAVYYEGVSGETVTPSGSDATTGTSASGMHFYSAYWVAGTVLTVTGPTAGPPVTWTDGGPVNQCDVSGGQYSCSITVTSTSTSAYIVGPGANEQQIVVSAQGGALQFTPPSVTLCATQAQQVGLSCSTTGQITASPLQGYSFPSGAQWQLGTVSSSTGSFSPFSGSTMSGSIPQGSAPVTVSLSYSQLQSEVSFSSLSSVVQVVLQVTSAQVTPTLTILPSLYGSGGQQAQETPAPGTYVCSVGGPVCQPGQPVKISITPPANWFVVNWVVNGQVQSSSQDSITVNIPQSGLTDVLATLMYAPTTLVVQQESLGNGLIAQTNPSPGTYTCSATSSVCQPGKSLQVSVTVPSGYQFQGWIENGVNVGTANPITVNMPKNGTVAIVPVLEYCPSGSACTPSGPGGSSGSSTNGGLVWSGFGIGALGALLLGFDLSRGKSKGRR